MTDATEQAIQLRALVSASNSGIAWDLRCLVRERLIAFLRREPGGLPRIRAELEDGAGELAARAGGAPSARGRVSTERGVMPSAERDLAGPSSSAG